MVKIIVLGEDLAEMAQSRFSSAKVYRVGNREQLLSDAATGEYNLAVLRKSDFSDEAFRKFRSAHPQTATSFWRYEDVTRLFDIPSE
jgi:hypothetical protein